MKYSTTGTSGNASSAPRFANTKYCACVSPAYEYHAMYWNAPGTPLAVRPVRRASPFAPVTTCCGREVKSASVGPIAGKSATVLFANDDPLTSGADDTGTDLYWAPLTLGKKNILATYTFDGQKVIVSGDVTFPLPLPDLAGTQGNVNFAGGRLWWDDESLPEADRELLFADATGTFPGVSIGPTKTVGASRPGAGDIQPALDGDTLYWMGDGHILTADLASGADPSLPASWTPAKPIVGPGSSVESRVLAVGEPTIAHVGPETWLHFVYIKKTDTGYDANVGRIRRRTPGT